MKIGGFEKYSFIDYPGFISSVIFTRGCNFHCPYCHNPELVNLGKPASSDKMPTLTEIFSFLAKRKKYIEGVVITGGEPALHPDLPDLCHEIKKRGFFLKIDTNGSFPGVISDLLKKGLVDYVAMDIKTDPERYAPVISSGINPADIRKSIELILASGLPHEFRTTCIKPVVDLRAFRSIAKIVKGAFLYALQMPRITLNAKVLDLSFFDQNVFAVDDLELEAFRSILSPSVGSCIIR